MVPLGSRTTLLLSVSGNRPTRARERLGNLLLRGRDLFVQQLTENTRALGQIGQKLYLGGYSGELLGVGTTYHICEVL